MKNNNVRNLLLGLYDHKLQRKIGLKEMDKLLYDATVKGCDSDIKAIHERQYYWATTFIKRLFINLDKGYISKKVYERLLLDVLLKGAFHIDIDKKVGKHLGNTDEYRSGYVNKLDAYKEKYNCSYKHAYDKMVDGNPSYSTYTAWRRKSATSK